MPPPNEGNFLIELDGVPVLMASEVTGLKLDHTVTSTRVAHPMPATPLQAASHLRLNCGKVR